MKKAALHNLGCKVNAYETEAMQQMLEEAGYTIVPFSEKADVYVINTCSVTNIADRKSRQMLHRARKKNPDAVVVAAGCYVQTSEEEALKDASIDILIGNNQKAQLIARLDAFFAEKAKKGVEDSKKTEAVVDINGQPQIFEELPLSQTREHTRAFLKVQDGCNQFCSYCIIPYARGRVRSCRPETVLKQVRLLAENGCREIVLTGIHLSSYGVDFGGNLLELIRQVHEVEGIERIRLGSLEPRVVTEEFVRALAELPKICPHFHLSLQSGCDETLMRMNRKYTTAEYEMSCQLLRKYFAHPAITTDVIVGFPGETEEEYQKTKDFLQRIHFYEMHIFKYSVRKGTRAAGMEQQIPEEVKTRRSAELLELAERMSEEFREYYVGKDQEVLFEEPVNLAGEPYYTGYNREYVRMVTKSKKPLENCLCRGTVTGKVSDGTLLLELPENGDRSYTL